MAGGGAAAEATSGIGAGDATTSGAGMCTRGVLHAASIPTMTNHRHTLRTLNMGLILLEALAAGGILVLIVWWTMFSGRDKGELKDRDEDR
jgi:hypothetical protein